MVLQRRVGCGATHKGGLNPELMNDHKYRGGLVLGIQSPIRSLGRLPVASMDTQRENSKYTSVYYSRK